MREGPRAAPFLSETLNDPVCDAFGSMNRLKPFAKGRHEQHSDKEDCWFLADPHVASVLLLSTVRAIRDPLFFPLKELGIHCADARGVF